jgi:haloacetate dehalogenase
LALTLGGRGEDWYPEVELLVQVRTEMFEGFTSDYIDAGTTKIFLRRAGTGAPLLLLHGFPETHAMWHAVAPALVRDFTVVCADLRGYGASGAPPSSEDHSPYAKRAMGEDMIAVMGKLGFDRFAVAGHDRGGRVAYRMALDSPRDISHLGVLDIIPTSEAFGRADSRLTLGYWPWSFMSQPEPMPERLVAADPAAVIDNVIAHWGTEAASFSPELRRLYIEALRQPETIHAICEEFRAAATRDVENDKRDRAQGRKIECPTLVLWGEKGPLDTWYADSGGPLGIWRAWATNLTGRAIGGGHFFPEGNPEETTTALREFFRS